MQKCIIGCWIQDFDKILLRNCKTKSLLWIYRWTCWATCWQPAQIWWVRSIPSNRTWVDCSGILATWTVNLPMVQFCPRLRPEVMVRNHCWHYILVKLFSFTIAYVNPDIAGKMVGKNNCQLFLWHWPGDDELILPIVTSIVDTTISSIVNAAIAGLPDLRQKIKEL